MNQNQLFVVRHGESENNILRIDCSKLENKDKYGLTEKGKKEVRVQAGGFEDFDLIVTSPFKRTVETAEIFAEFSKCEFIENVQLKEVDYGDFELCEYGASEVFFKENGCDENIPFPNGESLMGARNRTTEFLKQIEQEHSGKRVLIVTHGHIVLFLRELLEEGFDYQKEVDEYDDVESRKVFKLF